jgi:hypothetical protein
MSIAGAEFKDAIDALGAAVSAMADGLPKPQVVTVPSGYQSYRYVEKTIEQAIFLKAVRILSAVRALAVLIESGLILDAGASMRILDELGSDMMFLCGPKIGGAREPRHDTYLTEFFQEEFDQPDPLQSSQSRHRVSRRHIRAYISRTYSNVAGVTPSFLSDVFETVESAVSGYVHGAAGHILDVYDGHRFMVPIPRGERPLAVLERQFASYLFRAMVSVIFGLFALGLLKAASDLHAAAGRVEHLVPTPTRPNP